MFVEISRVNHDVMNLVTKATRGNTWRIIPFSKWLITMVIVRPLAGVNHFPSKWPWTWLINGRDPNYLRYLGAHPPRVRPDKTKVSCRSPGSPSCLPFRIRFRALGWNLVEAFRLGCVFYLALQLPSSIVVYSGFYLQMAAALQDHLRITMMARKQWNRVKQMIFQNVTGFGSKVDGTQQQLVF